MMSRESQKKDGTGLLSKLMLGIVLAVGGMLILADTGIELPERISREPSAVHTETPGQPETKPTLPDRETETTQVETLPVMEETAPETTEPVKPAPISGSDGPVEYEILRWDRSYTNAEGRKQMTYYYDYPVIHSDEQAHVKINEMVYQKAEAFMTEMTQEQIETPVMSVFNTPTDCIYTIETEVCQNGEGILSLLYTSDYYMGGNHSIKNRHAQTYSLRTGEEIGLLQLMDMDEETLLSELQTRAYTILEAQAGPMLIANARDVLEQYVLEDFEFFIQDGQIILLFDTYQFTAGAAGPQFVSTDLFISYK